jgi:hypothetical protein
MSNLTKVFKGINIKMAVLVYIEEVSVVWSFLFIYSVNFFLLRDASYSYPFIFHTRTCVCVCVKKKR